MVAGILRAIQWELGGLTQDMQFYIMEEIYSSMLISWHMTHGNYTLGVLYKRLAALGSSGTVMQWSVGGLCALWEEMVLTKLPWDMGS